MQINKVSACLLRTKNKIDLKNKFDVSSYYVFVEFQMAFWQNRSISLVDMYIDNTDSADNVGQINFSLEYDFENMTLILRIIQVNCNFSKTWFKYATCAWFAYIWCGGKLHKLAFSEIVDTRHMHSFYRRDKSIMKVATTLLLSVIITSSIITWGQLLCGFCGMRVKLVVVGKSTICNIMQLSVRFRIKKNAGKRQLDDDIMIIIFIIKLMTGWVSE